MDSLSSDDMRIKLSDGSMSKPIKVEVYAMKHPLVSPINGKTFPLFISKGIAQLTMFIDLSHPYFTKCNLSKEQLVASEVAMYILDITGTLSNLPNHNLSSLTWNLLEEYWEDEIELNSQTIYKEATDFLNDFQSKLKDILNSSASMFFDELSPEEKTLLTNKMIQKGVDLSSIGELKESGDYLLYTPYSFLLSLFRETPESFFGGGIWTTSLASGGENLLGSENVEKARKKILEQYFNYLQDVINFAENKYSDTLTLQRVKLSVDFLTEKMI